MFYDSRTYRRRLLDGWLVEQENLVGGRVLDIGGKRENKRGDYRPPTNRASQWLYVNIDQSTSPDIVADAARVPLPDGTADTIICTEMLEHVPHPREVVAEMWRLLRHGGVIIGSVPFLYPVHADPYDFQRFTPEGLQELFRAFPHVAIVAMGGPWGSLAMNLELVARRPDGARYWRAIRWRAAFCFAQPAYWLDRKWQYVSTRPYPAFTTGFGFVVRK